MQRGRTWCAGRGWNARFWALGMLALVAMSTPVDAAPNEIQLENLRVGFASAQQNNLFKIGAWTPVWLQFRGGAEPFSGLLEISVPDDDGTPTFFRQAITIPAGANVRAVTYARPGTRDPNFMIRLFDENGRRKFEVDGSNAAQLGPMGADETLFITLGRPSGVEQVPSIPGFSADTNNGGQEFTVARVDSIDGQLPGRWYGYDAATAIVLDTNDKTMMGSLTVQGQALVDWVARGGHLVVSVGANWAAVRDSVLAPMLPAVPAGEIRMTTIEGFDTFTGLTTGSLLPPGADPVMVAKLEDVEARGGKILAASGEVPLVVRGAYGFGRVTLVGIDVDQKPFSDWANRAMFWVKAIDIHRQTGEVSASTRVTMGGGGRSMYQSGVSDLLSQLRVALEQFPGIRLIPFGWVAFCIFLYILLIGPGDYFFLKKVVKRMELTWVTFPLIVVSVSLLAYFAAYMVKGRELRVNKVDVVDVDQVAGVERGISVANLFSPQNRDYDIAIVPRSFDPAANQSKAPAATIDGTDRPPAGTEVLMSWVGVPEAGFGGMGNSARMAFSGSGYASLPEGSSEQLHGVRVPIWSTKLLGARWFGPATPLADSDLVPVGTDRLAGTVTSRLDVPLKNALMIFGKQVYDLGTISPGETKRVELAHDRQLSGLLKSQEPSFTTNYNGPQSTANRQLDRANLLLAFMFHDSRSTVSAERTMRNLPFRFLDLTGQLALDRPMLVGRVDRPGATLALGNAPAEPRVEQTTMLRVILPLNRSEESRKSR